MRVLVIPDIHLKPWIFNEAEKIMESDSVDMAVCLMDIPDDFHKRYDIELYKSTFERAVDFENKYPDTQWVYGNHDLSYVWNKPESGFSSMAAYTARNGLYYLEEAVKNNGKEIQYVLVIDDVIFSHGGLTELFVQKHIKNHEKHTIKYIASKINKLGVDEMWNDISPIWHRPQHNFLPMYKEEKYLQVVGHTPVVDVYMDNNFISTDTFSTYQDGTPYGTQVFTIVNTKTWSFYTKK